MYFAKAHKTSKLILALSIVAMVGTPAARSQGMMEYGGLMAMPKGIPTGDTIKAMTRGFGAIPNALPGQTSNGIPAGLSTTMPDGSVVIDPKKAKELSARADGYYRQAKQILNNKGAQTPAALKQAEKLLRDAITIRNAIWGYADPNIPKLLNQLAGVYELLKQPTTAESCYKNALVYINKKYGPGSAERLDTYVNLAPLLVKKGNLPEALSLEQQITLMKERQIGATDIGTIQARLTWAGTAKALDKPNAPDIYKQCLTDLEAAGNKISPDKVSKFKSEIIPSYIEVLKKQGREEEAAQATVLLSNVAAIAAPSAPAATPGSAPVAAPAITTSPSAATTANPAPVSGAQSDLQPAPGTIPAAAQVTTPGSKAVSTPATTPTSSSTAPTK
jgi:hypothetical protein